MARDQKRGPGERPGCWDTGHRWARGATLLVLQPGCAAQGLRGAQTSRVSRLQPLLPLGPTEGGQQVWPQVQGCSPALRETDQGPGTLSTSRWPSGVMGTCSGGVGGPVLAPEPSPQSSEYEPGSLGQRSEGQGIQEGPQHPAPGCVPMPGVTGPNMPHFGEVCRFQGRAAYGGLGRTSCGVALGARAAWQSHLGQSHLADVPSPKPRGEDAAGKPQGAFIRERPCIAFHVTKPRGEPPT